MYTPDKHLDAAHQLLQRMTSNEVNTDAPAQHSSATTHSHEVWQHLPQGLSSLAAQDFFATQHGLRLQPEGYGLTDFVDADHGHSFGPWGADKNSLQNSACPPQHHLPTPPLRSNSWRPLFPRSSDLDSAQSRGSHLPYHSHPDLTQRRSVPNGLPSSPEDFLPQTHAYLTSNGIPVNNSSAPIWNTDGIGIGFEDWNFQDQLQQNVFRHLQLPGYTTRHGAPLVQPPIYQFIPPQSVHSRRASSVASSSILAHNNGQTTQLPVMQEWRTDILARPSKTFRKLPDAATRRKQERYRRKGEARRNTIAARVTEKQTSAHRKITATVPAESFRSSQIGSAIASDQNTYDDQEVTEVSTDYLQPQNQMYHNPVPEVPPSIIDELPQAIVENYEDYKCAVYHYQLQPKGYDFAERWLQELLDTTLHAEYKERHFSHVSQGFIKDGNRHSILVLHNATNPFEYEPTPSSTITIGVYGYHWYQHNEIHWTTIATDQRDLFMHCIQAGWLVEKSKWTHDARPTEKRFHRAYWLAANRQHMRGLLNRGPSSDKPHDLVKERSEEDPDRDFSISEDDLTNEWDVTDGEAAAAWQSIQVEVEALGEDFDVCGPGWQHLVISNSEW